jgi:hypothetical protein
MNPSFIAQARAKAPHGTLLAVAVMMAICSAAFAGLLTLVEDVAIAGIGAGIFFVTAVALVGRMG